MGQAKRRGTFEERKEQSIKRKLEEEQNKLLQYQQWFDSLSPEEQERIKKEKAKQANIKLDFAKILGLIS